MLGRAKCREKSAEQESWETCPQVAHAFRKFVGSVGKLKLHVQCTAEKGLGIRLRTASPTTHAFSTPIACCSLGFRGRVWLTNLRRLQSRHLSLTSLSPWVDNGKK